MCVGVGEHAGQQHLVRAHPNARHEVVRLEGRLLYLGVEIRGIAVQCQPADLVQRMVAVRPYLGEVEGVEPVDPGLLEGHELDAQGPARVVAPPDRIEQVAAVVVAVLTRQPVAVGLGEALDALVRLEVVLDREPLTLGVDPHVGVAGVAVHVPPRLGDAAVAHQSRDLVC